MKVHNQSPLTITSRQRVVYITVNKNEVMKVLTGNRARAAVTGR